MADASKMIIPPIIVIVGPIPASIKLAAIHPKGCFAISDCMVLIPAKNKIPESIADIPAIAQSFLLVNPASARMMPITYRIIEKISKPAPELSLVPLPISEM
jgi:hypothetical protein